MISYAWRLGLLVPLVALLSLGPRPAQPALRRQWLAGETEGPDYGAQWRA